MLKTAFALAVIVIVVSVLVRLFESRFAFFPVAGETVTPLEYGVAHHTLSIATDDGERLSGWALPNATPRAQVLYFHGNGGNLSIWAPILAATARHGYSVVAFDYRGYGNSSGRPSERGLYHDVDAIVERFWSEARAETPIVYWGRSLGTVMAAYAARRRAPHGLILESGFPDARSLASTSPLLAFLALFSTLRFPGAAFLEDLTAPVLVMHGDHDHVIPIDQGRRLFAKIPGRKQFITIPGGDHNDVAPPDPPAYWRDVGEFVAGLSKRES